jgi:predicted nucleic acid-binding protein
MPMPGRYLLDTNIVIALFANEAEAAGHMAELAEVFVPSIVLGSISNATTGYRSYSPKLGRWVNRDPVGEKGGDKPICLCPE